ncbi:MAG: glycine zipper domain-containing protein [Candidatus Omnitrophica bacterium]|nr:glycine zipper domain-containing protein [Candidatus Omnitrophota bacterium]
MPELVLLLERVLGQLLDTRADMLSKVQGAVIGGAAGGLGGAMVGEQMANKFCPVCGADYPGDVQYCPKDGTELKAKQ